MCKWDDERPGGCGSGGPAPPRAHFGLGVHLLEEAWHAMGFTAGRILMRLETDYRLKMSRGTFDKIQTLVTRLFAPPP